MNSSATRQPRTLATVLDDAEKLVELVREATGLDAAEAAARLVAENGRIGSSVWQELQRRKITPYLWSDALVEFYATTTAFVFESLVWNRSALKREMQQWIADFLGREFARPVRVLVFGDGLGFDSAFLALAGHEVSYFEVSQNATRFAGRLFEACDCRVETLTSVDQFRDRKFDAVVCLDVLEHVPDPAGMVGLLASLLAPDGRLVVHAPFWYLTPSVATHLASNRKFSGDLRRLYRPAGLRPVDGALFWNPIALAPKTAKSGGRLAGRLQIALGGLLLAAGRIWSAPHAWIVGGMLARSLKPWPEMEKLAAARN